MISRIVIFRFQQMDLLGCSLPFEREREARSAGLQTCVDSIRPDRAIAVSSRLELLFAADPMLPVKAANFK